MLENKIEQKPSVQSSVQSPEITTPNQPIYFDSVQALADFDNEVAARSEVRGQIADPRVAKFLANAQVLMKHREYPLAMNLLRQASNLDSKNASILRTLGDCLEKVNRTEEALIARKALVSVEYGFGSLYDLGTTLYKLGRDQEAMDKYYESLAVIKNEDSRLFELYKNMGNIFVRQGDFEAAEEFYNKAYTMNPNSDILLVNFGTLEVQRQDFEKSLFCFRRAVEINAENDKAWVGLAMVHNQFADNDLAWANIETALDINPRNRTAVHLAANWGVRDQKLQKSIEALQTYLSQVEQDEEMSLVLINLFCSAAQYERALLEIDRVLLWNPAQEEVRSLKKKLSRAQGKVA